MSSKFFSAKITQNVKVEKYTAWIQAFIDNTLSENRAKKRSYMEEHGVSHWQAEAYLADKWTKSG